MIQGVLKTHGICLMMYFKNNWNAGPFFYYFMDILEEKKHIYIFSNLYEYILVYNYFIWSMIQRGSDTSFTNLWSLLLYIQSLLHYIGNAQENKKNTILSYNIAENSERVKRN
jgi:uncharacterized membrane protein YecN with MAPEG domain